MGIREVSVADEIALRVRIDRPSGPPYQLSCTVDIASDRHLMAAPHSWHRGFLVNNPIHYTGEWSIEFRNGIECWTRYPHAVPVNQTPFTGLRHSRNVLLKVSALAELR